MQLASSIYKGGELIAANEADYSSSRNLGLVCPFCRESIFLVKAHTRKGSAIAAAWHHYKKSISSAYCENRALTAEGREELKQLQPKAQNQRLKLFNRRFWEIFKTGKVIPPNLKGVALQFITEDRLDKMVLHCHERWKPEEIIPHLPPQIEQMTHDLRLKETLLNHPAAQGFEEEVVEAMVSNFQQSNFGMVRLKILSEVIAWLSTRTAIESFAKLIYLSVVDCAEVLPPPWHSNDIALMVVTSLIITDWEKAIASLPDQTRALGFASSR